MAGAGPDTAARAPRLDALDVARALALLAMAIYHLAWDLKWFGLVDWPVDTAVPWRRFAQAIAFSFLFLVGIGLVLAHGEGIRWRKALARAGRIALAAAAISAATWFGLGDNFVRFGILHMIAVGSLLALPALRWPAHGTLALAAAIGLAPVLLPPLSFPGDAWLAWTGLAGTPPPAVDHVPVAPWLGAILAGVGCARLLRGNTALRRLAGWRAGTAGLRLAARAGRHSLAVYLLHQPVLLGAIWALLTLGLLPDPARTAFVDQCAMACAQTTHLGEAACVAACRCTLERAEADGSWAVLTRDPADAAGTAALQNHYAVCLRGPGPAPQ